MVFTAAAQRLQLESSEEMFLEERKGSEVTELCPLSATLWTVSHQFPQPMGFSSPSPGIEPGSPALQADALPSEPPGKPQHDTLICLEADADCRLTSQQELLVEQPTQGLFKCPGIPHTMV